MSHVASQRSGASVAFFPDERFEPKIPSLRRLREAPLSAVHTLEEVGDAAYQVHHNLHEGKIGVLCLAPEEGLGIDDPELRARVGEDRITLFRRHGA